eukprot:NODE_26_length_40862_cov_0.679513.p12 type:complete len:382 gc:universal NODE_26_length_40862_cov_0.679513:34739-35884(+)
MYFLSICAQIIFHCTDDRIQQNLDTAKNLFENTLIINREIHVFVNLIDLGISLNNNMNYGYATPSFVIGSFQNMTISLTVPHYLLTSASSIYFDEAFKIDIEEKYIQEDILDYIIVHELFHGFGFESTLTNEFSGSAGQTLSDNELVFLPPTFWDILLNKNGISLKNHFFKPLDGLCWSSHINPMHKKSKDEIYGRVGSFLHKKNTDGSLENMDIGPFMSDNYTIRFGDQGKNVYVLDGFVDKFITGLRAGAGFCHIDSGIMHIKSNDSSPSDKGIYDYLKNDPAWDILCWMGYQFRNRTCPKIIFESKFVKASEIDPKEVCSQYLDLDLYETEVKYWVSLRIAILLAVGLVALIILWFLAKQIYRFFRPKTSRPKLKVFT